jgi:Undecaprenyl-phosphate glucose phosphotransferase
VTELSELRGARSSPSYFSAGASHIGSLELLAILYEALVVVAASICGGIFYHLAYYEVFPKIDGFIGIGIFGAVLHMFIAKSQGLYDAPVLAGLDRRWSRLVGGWLLVVLLLTLLMFLLKVGAGVSRGSMIMFGLIGCVSLIAGRAAFQRPLRKAIDKGLLATRRTVVMGSPDELSRLRRSDLLKKYGLNEVGRIALAPADDDESRGADAHVAARAIAAARELGVDEIALAIRWSEEARILALCELLRVSPLPIHLLPDRTTELFLSLPIIATGPLPTVEMQRAPLSPFELFCKRTFDLVAASSMLLFFLPVMLVTAILIKLDSKGPVIFRQRRNGFDGKSFAILKFRTMSVQQDGDAIEQAQPNDVRVTRLGRILRRRSIDELPQLVNVIRGEMSLVGPRPHAIVHDDKYSKLIASYAYRQHVKPGITGLAQVNGQRGATPAVEDMEKRVEYDLAYIASWSFMLDLRIIVQTLGEILRSEAY